MSNITDAFTSDPAKFMKDYVVFVANTNEMGDSNTPGTRSFYFWKGSGNSALLKEHRFGKSPGTTVKGYWLPWRTMQSVSMDVRSDANYLFTSQMTGCRFSVLTKEGAAPKVAHIAGTLSQTKREAETTKLVESMGGSDKVRARSLSVSQGSTHGYSGQTVNPGSAFVYGVRDAESGTWSFAAQVVGENMLPTVDLANVPLSKIKDAFTFD